MADPSASTSPTPLFGAVTTASISATTTSSSALLLVGAASSAVGTGSSPFEASSSNTNSSPMFGAASSAGTSGQPSFGASSSAASMGSSAASSASPLLGPSSTAASSASSWFGATGAPSVFSSAATTTTSLFGCSLTPSSAASGTSTSTTTASQTSSSLVVASSSGTSSSTTAAVSARPKLPLEIIGKTVDEFDYDVEVGNIFLGRTEIIKEWNAELQERAGKFQKQAAAIAEWDKRILRNRNVILRLEIEAAKVVETQASLERQLELIETHQQEVDKALQSMEEEGERIYNDEQGLLLDDEAASTRDAMYEQAEFIEREMEQMTEQIKSIIQSLNASQGGDLDAIDGMTPLDVVVKILNNQLSSLMWIDEKAEEFSSRIQKLANQDSIADNELLAPRFWTS
ncbi:hypothetical protein SLEP1_g23903 [Rubroshorea leprosula]|uniref:Nucleoporin NSP1-like C-terminal domain-containing protein n=1 Tax=Rubroshorea leprosula TaxID=152421 RepID=A0AAV5JNE4_9ROSI|nr:hypothetical protein SLEP1_g23903 [Rubroshorea leprosula]